MFSIASASGDFPTGATIDPNSGEFSWSPIGSEGGQPWQKPYNFTVTIDDGEFSDSADVTLEIVPEPSTIAMLLGASLLGLAMWRRRR